MGVFAQSLGLVTEGDYLSLSEGLTVRADVLNDQAINANHQLSIHTARPLRDLVTGIEAMQWFERGCGYGLTPNQLADILIFLNDIGGLRVSRKLRAAVRVAVLRIGYQMRGVSLRAVGHRFPGTFSGVVRAVSQSIVSIVCMLSIVGFFSYGANLSPNFYIMANIIFLFALFVSTIAHEYVHVLLVRSRVSTPIVLRRGLRIGVIHVHSSKRSEIVSALLGPLAGVVSASAISIIVYVLPVPHPAWQLALLVAVFHVFSWLPSYGDGRALQHTLMRRNYA